jgi:hypothetical protein
MSSSTIKKVKSLVVHFKLSLRLAAHDSMSDSMFVSAFYLTFRLFATPIELAKALVDRFDYVTESPHIVGPVRLRVYNVFKGWLESYWRNLSDREVL